MKWVASENFSHYRCSWLYCTLFFSFNCNRLRRSRMYQFPVSSFEICVSLLLIHALFFIFQWLYQVPISKNRITWTSHSGGAPISTKTALFHTTGRCPLCGGLINTWPPKTMKLSCTMLEKTNDLDFMNIFIVMWLDLLLVTATNILIQRKFWFFSRFQLWIKFEILIDKFYAGMTSGCNYYD